MKTEQMILERLESIERILRKLTSPHPPVLVPETDFIRAKRAALDNRERNLQRRQSRQQRDAA